LPSRLALVNVIQAARGAGSSELKGFSCFISFRVGLTTKPLDLAAG